MTTKLPKGFENIDSRSFQVWNSDIKAYRQENVLDLSNQLVVANGFSNGISGIDDSGLKMYQMIDGSWRMMGVSEWTGAAGPISNVTMINLNLTPQPFDGFSQFYTENFIVVIRSCYSANVAEPAGSNVFQGILRQVGVGTFHLEVPIAISTGDLITVDFPFMRQPNN